MIEGLVASSVRYRWIVIALVAAMTVVSVGIAVHLFRINTDVERLIDPKEPWRQDEIAFEKAFPQRSNLIVAVIDGQTPEETEEAAASLTRALSERKNIIETVYRPDGGPFFDKNGLLLMPQAELDKTLDQLTQQQGLLGPLAADDEGAERVRETLLTFLTEKGSFVATAERTHLHKNTVKYRVDKAIELRGRPIDDDRFNLELALIACRWLGESVLT